VSAARDALSAEVLARWIAHTERYEGRIPWLYLDIKGLVTIGAGVLVDPVALALRLPLRHADGSTATPAEIEAEWKAIKARPTLAQQGAGAAGRIARLRLSGADLDALTWARLDSTVAALVRRWPELPTWPWQAQFAVCSWAWAVGAMAQGWPRFEAALHAQDWTTAADECRIREAGNPGVAPRNVENRRLFLDAVPPVVPAPRDTEPVPDTDPMPDSLRATTLDLVRATIDQSTRNALADGYRRR
jgi:GH24 family phage-related lysozyme (muramidase)